MCKVLKFLLVTFQNLIWRGHEQFRWTGEQFELPNQVGHGTKANPTLGFLHFPLPSIQVGAFPYLRVPLLQPRSLSARNQIMIWLIKPCPCQTFHSKLYRKVLIIPTTIIVVVEIRFLAVLNVYKVAWTMALIKSCITILYVGTTTTKTVWFLIPFKEESVALRLIWAYTIRLDLDD